MGRAHALTLKEAHQLDTLLSVFDWEGFHLSATDPVLTGAGAAHGDRPHHKTVIQAYRLGDRIVVYDTNSNAVGHRPMLPQQ